MSRGENEAIARTHFVFVAELQPMSRVVAKWNHTFEFDKSCGAVLQKNFSISSPPRKWECSIFYDNAWGRRRRGRNGDRYQRRVACVHSRLIDNFSTPDECNRRTKQNKGLLIKLLCSLRLAAAALNSIFFPFLISFTCANISLRCYRLASRLRAVY